MGTDIRISPKLKGVEYIVSYNDVNEAHQLVEDAIRINTIVKSTTIDTFELSINGGAFAVPTLPLDLSANDELIWQIVFNVGETLGSLSVKAEKL